ncbi:glycosyltransferase [Granulosicoccus sp.]|nr:glycosyltransferase [Granulosicoccus sp.]MDB4222429.1 glycosyltransferase [Granulosicoccus sp.]
MKLVHVVPHTDQEASGPSYSVPRLCESLAAQGNEVELSCLAAKGEIPGVTLDLHQQWPFLGRFAISISHARALRRKAAHVDIVHNHSLWSMVNLAPGWVVPGQRAKLVTSPRGTLSSWALSRSRLQKRILWPLQRRALQRADLLHATSEGEYRDIRTRGFDAPVVILPNGIDLPVMPPSKRVAEQRTLLFLGRIHPTKCIDRLLQAWSKLQEEHLEWRLLIVGLGEPEYENEMRSLSVSLNCKRVEFSEALYGADKAEAFIEADLFVLPSHSENFGMAVAEALAHCCPAVVSKGAPWSRLESEKCGLWVEHDVPSLTAALNAAMLLPSQELAAMGIKGRDWMERDFSWDWIAYEMGSAYSWLVQGGEPPACVRLD